MLLGAMTATTTATTAINNNLFDAVSCGRLTQLSKARKKSKTTLRMRNILFDSLKAIMNWINLNEILTKLCQNDARLIKVIVFRCCYCCYCCCYVFQLFLLLSKRNFRYLFMFGFFFLFFLFIMSMLLFSSGTCHKAKEKKCIIEKNLHTNKKKI